MNHTPCTLELREYIIVIIYETNECNTLQGRSDLSPFLFSLFISLDFLLTPRQTRVTVVERPNLPATLISLNPIYNRKLKYVYYTYVFAILNLFLRSICLNEDVHYSASKTDICIIEFRDIRRSGSFF